MTLAALDTPLAAQPSCAVYAGDDITAKVATQALAEQGWAQDSVHIGGIDAAIDDIAKGGCPQILIVDLAGSPDPRADMQALAEVCEPGTLVTALGTWNDVALYRDLLQAGVQDYLMKPVAPETLTQSLALASTLLAEPEPTQSPQNDPAIKQQVVVTGVRGGLGSSTLAVNLAMHFAAAGRQTALLDMDLVFGTAAMQFDLEPGRGLVDALENPARVDGLFLERAVVKPTPTLSILGSEVPPASVGDIASGAEEQLLNTLKDNFSHLVVDLPRHQLSQFPKLLENASDLIILADLSVVSARDTIRLLAHARAIAPHLSIHLVGAMLGLGGREVDEKDFENSVEMPFTAMLPFEPKVILSAAQANKLVVDGAPNSKIAQVVKTLARAVDAQEEQPDDSGWFAKLLGK